MDCNVGGTRNLSGRAGAAFGLAMLSGLAGAAFGLARPAAFGVAAFGLTPAAFGVAGLARLAAFGVPAFELAGLAGLAMLTAFGLEMLTARLAMLAGAASAWPIMVRIDGVLGGLPGIVANGPHSLLASRVCSCNGNQGTDPSSPSGVRLL